MENVYIYEKLHISDIELLDELSIYQKTFYKIGEISNDLKHAWNRINTVPAAQVLTLTLWSLNLPLSSSSTTSRELLSQFSACSGWRWFEVGEKMPCIGKPVSWNF